MRKVWNTCRNHLYWFLILMVSDILFITFLWLVDAEVFFQLSCGLLLGTAGLFAVSMLFTYKRDSQREKLFLAFLENPQQLEKEKAIRKMKGRDKVMFSVLSSHLGERDCIIREQNFHIKEYEEYIEAWAHEIKTPLALMTFILDNRQDEFEPHLHHRLEYIRSRMQEDIDRMLYYARLKAASTDYLFEIISIQECCYDVLKEYNILLQEHKFSIINQVEDIEVVTDRKGICFLLSQFISNAIKYAKKDGSVPSINLYTSKEGTGDLILGIRDNGIGVKQFDIPFLFQKGFTGDSGEGQRKSTGMGLYLAKQLADKLKINIEIKEDYEEGFEILVCFPGVNSKDTGYDSNISSLNS